jgi:glycolate oxidase
VEAIARRCNRPQPAASRNSEDERLVFWAGRKAAFPAVGPHLARLSLHGRHHPAQAAAAGARKACADSREIYGLQVANVFHAGDGNLHPLILFDANTPGELDRAEKFGADILRLCVKVGGVLTGEHGVGIEKRDLMPEMFSEIDLNQQQRLKCAFDAIRASSIPARCSRLHRCAELGRIACP